MVQPAPDFAGFALDEEVDALVLVRKDAVEVVLELF